MTTHGLMPLCRKCWRIPCPKRPFSGFCAALATLAAAALLAALPCAAQAAPGVQTLNVTAYNIDAQIQPKDHTLTATAQVTFTSLNDQPAAVFDLHGALNVSQVTDASGAALNGVRGQDATLVVTPPTPLQKDQTYIWTFHYSGTLENGNGGPVPGLQLASVEAPITYLLYAGEWFPITGYTTDRFTADIHVTAPSGYVVVGSGRTGRPVSSLNGTTWDFKWDKPGFPGTIIAGQFTEVTPMDAPNIHIYCDAAHKAIANDYAQTALREFAYFTSTFGIPQSTQLNVVELPDDTVPAYWAPQIAAIASAHFGGRNEFRLLANTIAHQWWGSEVSPQSLDDTWITNGMSRYAELMYLEDDQGASALKAAIEDVSAGALAYDTIPLSTVGTLQPWSPQFQSMTLEKGGMVFHMLRGIVGDRTFARILRTAIDQYKGQGISTSEFEKIAGQQSQLNLVPFFSEWLDGTGAPQFQDKYAVYRLGNNQGFRTIGEVQDNMDLLNMPVDLEIETQGKTVNRRIDVVGTDSQYVVDTFGMPRQIVLDPNDWVLKETPALQVRVYILRGQQLAAQGDATGALAQYQLAKKANPDSSLASYRIGELLFTMRNYQAAVNAYRDALAGDGEPAWTQVWSYIAIGKIFDITGQRDRAITEYREALETNDNTAGALNEARHWIQTPYKQPNS
ncbi:MAG TPA: M1 family aminopeptidase [Acidobacteriaceae bacterium]|nr:M1 family aminopeptidase [Acidobacteriaceae bacterium]